MNGWILLGVLLLFLGVLVFLHAPEYRRFSLFCNGVEASADVVQRKFWDYDKQEYSQDLLFVTKQDIEELFDEALKLKRMSFYDKSQKSYRKSVLRSLNRWVIRAGLEANGIDVRDPEVVKAVKGMEQEFLLGEGYRGVDALHEARVMKGLISSEEGIPSHVLNHRQSRHEVPVLAGSGEVAATWDEMLLKLGGMTRTETMEVELGEGFVESLSKELSRQGVRQAEVEGWNLQFNLKGLFLALHG